MLLISQPEWVFVELIDADVSRILSMCPEGPFGYSVEGDPIVLRITAQSYKLEFTAIGGVCHYIYSDFGRYTDSIYNLICEHDDLSDATVRERDVLMFIRAFVEDGNLPTYLTKEVLPKINNRITAIVNDTGA